MQRASRFCLRRVRALVWQRGCSTQAVVRSDSSSSSRTNGTLSPRVRNSLTGDLEELRCDNSRRLTWYMCGPTVYDHAHLGHARAYVCFDIIHRILTDFFQYDVCLASGMTDIDDKIIARSIANGEDFLSLARRMEASFLGDMKALGVRPPSVYLRVSEHMPEILAYIQRIQERGFAYEADVDDDRDVDGNSNNNNTPSPRNVYFDVQAFHGKHGHSYGKLKPGPGLEPSSIDATEGEGAAVQAGKRNPVDFALWKKAVPGQPSWDSPWGAGRPGWHIECSAVASLTFGPELGMHSGGVDLQFPHHCNEIAQCEAHFGIDEWAKTWVHAGHLHIQGRKMSKSLKNFITIRELLETHSADQMRMFCLLHHYRATVEFSPDRMRDASRALARFSEVQSEVRRAVRQLPPDHSETKRWGAEERELQDYVLDAQARVRDALASDFDTPAAMEALGDIATRLFAYLHSSQAGARRELLLSTAGYLERTLGLFGLHQGGDASGGHAGTGGAEAAGGRGGGGAKAVGELSAAVDQLLTFRQAVRVQALKSLKSGGGAGMEAEDAKALLALCDDVRDRAMPEAGLLLKDAADGASSWRHLVPGEKEELLQGQQQQLKEHNSTQSKGDAPPQHPIDSSLFSQFDESGVPTHDAAGDPVSKSLRKKLAKKLAKYNERMAKRAS